MNNTDYLSLSELLAKMLRLRYVDSATLLHSVSDVIVDGAVAIHVGRDAHGRGPNYRAL